LFNGDGLRKAGAREITDAKAPGSSFAAREKPCEKAANTRKSVKGHRLSLLGEKAKSMPPKALKELKRRGFRRSSKKEEAMKKSKKTLARGRQRPYNCLCRRDEGSEKNSERLASRRLV
jgi:hypothetical protein